MEEPLLHPEKARLRNRAFEPRIRMETLNSTGTRCTISLTYLLFAVALFAGIKYQRAGTTFVYLSAAPCGAGGLGAGEACTTTAGEEVQWEAVVGGLERLQGSVRLAAVFPNATGANATQGIPLADGSVVREGTALRFHVRIDACRATMAPCWEQGGGDWDEVLDGDYESDLRRLSPSDVFWNAVDLDTANAKGTEFQVPLADFFQNQPSVGNTGALQGYRMRVAYLDDAGLLHSASGVDAVYELRYFAAETGTAARVCLLFINALSVCLIALWTRLQLQLAPRLRDWLLERLWLLVLVVGVALYQNPIWAVAQFLPEGAEQLALAAETCQLLGECLILFVLLCLADGLRPVAKGPPFYAAKAAVCAGIFAAGEAIQLFALPSLFGREERSFLAAEGWPGDLKRAYVATILAYFALLLAYLLMTALYVLRTGRHNQRIPYLENRYQQLSFRFFAALGVLTGVVFAVADLRFFVDAVGSGDGWSLDRVADKLNELLRGRGVDMSSVLFMTSYAFVLLYLYLPPADRSTRFNLAYAHTEEDALHLRRGGRPYFCLQTAVHMLDVAGEAYSSEPSAAVLLRHGFELCDVIAEASTDTHAIVLRHAEKGTVVVAFRGSATRAHWYTNLDFSQIEVDVLALGPPPEAMAPPADASPQAMHRLHAAAFGADHAGGAPPGGGGPDAAAEDAPVLEIEPPGGRRPDRPRPDGAALFLRDLGAMAPIRPRVHRGFWHAYAVVRARVHAAVALACASRRGAGRPRVVTTGHSLGGALAAIAAADLSANLRLDGGEALPAAQQSLGRLLFGMEEGEARGEEAEEDEREAKEEEEEEVEEEEVEGHGAWGAPVGPGLQGRHRALLRGLRNMNPARLLGLAGGGDGGGEADVSCYTFGQPRVGNTAWATRHEELVPESFRIAIDGDLVTNTPRAGYTCWAWKHCGVGIVVDHEDARNLLIDPSFIEQRFRAKPRRSLSSHLLRAYKRGLYGAFFGEESAWPPQAAEDIC